MKTSTRRPVAALERCPVCHDGLDLRPAGVCTACRAPHHVDCFAARRGCARGCHGDLAENLRWVWPTETGRVGFPDQVRGARSRVRSATWLRLVEVSHTMVWVLGGLFVALFVAYLGSPLWPGVGEALRPVLRSDDGALVLCGLALGVYLFGFVVHIEEIFRRYPT